MAARAYMCCEWDYDGPTTIDEVLLPLVVFFRGAVGDKFVFMDDNATCHRTLAVQDYLDSEVFDVSYDSAFSRSNSFENVCGMLWGGKLLVETILRQNKNNTPFHPCTHRGMG
ncbi:hypothetical protein TNCV_1680551 [Trichonephila clavipes]|nr:hypothetical protein TNCV_1680551 [Trichonephila clavipes]